MIPQKNQYVKIIFNNSIQIDGFVESWEDKIVLLKNNSYYIINNQKDILFYTIQNNIKKPEEIIKQNIETQRQFEQIKQSPSNDLRLKKLAELRQELINQEKQIIANKIKEPSSNSAGTQYGFPNFFKKPIIK